MIFLLFLIGVVVDKFYDLFLFFLQLIETNIIESARHLVFSNHNIKIIKNKHPNYPIVNADKQGTNNKIIYIKSLAV